MATYVRCACGNATVKLNDTALSEEYGLETHAREVCQDPTGKRIFLQAPPMAQMIPDLQAAAAGIWASAPGSVSSRSPQPRVVVADGTLVVTTAGNAADVRPRTTFTRSVRQAYDVTRNADQVLQGLEIGVRLAVHGIIADIADAWLPEEVPTPA